MSHTVITRLVLSALLLAALPAAAQTQTTSAQTQPSTPATDSPVGHWVAEHPSRGGIGSWWDFRPDGTLTMHIGTIVTSTITRSGDTFTSPPATTNGAPNTVTFHVEGNTLHIKSADGQEQTLERIGAAPSATDPLLGKWKPLPPATPSTDPNLAAQQKLMTTATLAFFPDNTESVRIPFSTLEGTWDAAAHTFHINNQKQSYTFQLTGQKLSLGQPPDGHKTDTYVPDPIL
jgi:hypothetical protein